ncbi:MAG: hypothetical protein WC903_02850 [Candidatus Margulisiibacteriota bacterium]
MTDVTTPSAKAAEVTANVPSLDEVTIPSAIELAAPAGALAAA